MLANVLVHWFLAGGPIMWPILGCLLLAGTVLVERLVWWWSLTRRLNGPLLEEVLSAAGQGRWDRVVELVRRSDDPFLQTLRVGLEGANVSVVGAMQLRAAELLDQAEKRLWVLSTMITLAPLLGLLGTVVGIMRSFHFLGDQTVAAARISGGIAEALIATASGLFIAILCLLPYNWLSRRLSRMRGRLQRWIQHVDLLLEAQRARGVDWRAMVGGGSGAPSPSPARIFHDF
ncbi:MotA/TolQ/ExbB proton channel family protein [Limisphaera ngatamarikiensis]|uniref:MotA/TolQ/ExbB proton channel family protein n=1 Tax=Limisphaera ngatamarikiensis TaxID=1324935 RepID=A0A6M1RKI6_9BACT|nr:MotA/TolQ/ExbB proton channel family protein [Limisphaera ngatamarikiensis]NGO37987.1 MotA/TolQ/ExbB proton channel family protein [Limisphaera ngatamarikiensis]